MTQAERTELLELKEEVGRRFEAVASRLDSLKDELTLLFKNGPISKLQTEVSVLRAEFQDHKEIEAAPTGRWAIVKKYLPMGGWFIAALLFGDHIWPLVVKLVMK